MELSFEDIPLTDEILGTEAAWAGSVPAFGDQEAPYVIQDLPGYSEYRSTLDALLREQLGDSFPMWRAMPTETFETWKLGADIGPVGFTLSESFAKASKEFESIVRTPIVIVRAMVRPEWIIMRGKLSELELVVDGSWIPLEDLQVV